MQICSEGAVAAVGKTQFYYLDRAFSEEKLCEKLSEPIVSDFNLLALSEQAKNTIGMLLARSLRGCPVNLQSTPLLITPLFFISKTQIFACRDHLCT